MKIYISGWLDLGWRIVVMLLMMVLPVVVGWWLLQSTNAYALITYAIILIPALRLYGMVCARLFSKIVAEGLVDFLLYPKRHLKKAPVILSRLHGLIAFGNYDQALTESLQLISEHPDSPEVTLFAANLCQEKFDDLNSAIAVINNYLQWRSDNFHHLNLEISLKMSDFLQQQYGPQASLEFLKAEMQQKCYRPGDLKIITRRYHGVCNSSQHPL